MTIFWLSFCDESRKLGDQFLGVVLIEAESLRGAITKCWQENCNPGGQVGSVEIDDEVLACLDPAERERLLKAPRGKLLSRAELTKLDLVAQEHRTKN